MFVNKFTKKNQIKNNKTQSKTNKVMFEKRPIWVVIVTLNVCILIWLISVQEPVMYDVSTSSLSSGSISNSYNSIRQLELDSASSNAAEVKSSSWQQHNGKHLLHKHATQTAAVSTTSSKSITTNYNSSNNNNALNDNTITTLYTKTWETNLNNYTSISSSTTITTSTDNIDRYTYEKLSLTSSSSYNAAAAAASMSPSAAAFASSLGSNVHAKLKFLNNNNFVKNPKIESKPTPPSWAKLTAVYSAALPPQDFTQLIDLHNFKYLIAQPVCGLEIEALILVHSAPANSEKRQLIRDTWGSVSRDLAGLSPLRICFLLGAVDNATQQQALQVENNQYGDLIQGSFQDDYRNMTYKHVMAFKWFLYNCPQAQVLIKVDDDVYVNTPQLLKYLRQQQLQQLAHGSLQHDNGQQQKQQLKPTLINIASNTKATTATAAATTIKTTKSTYSMIFDSLNIFSASKPPLRSATGSEAAAGTVLLQAPLTADKFNASQRLFQHPRELLFCQQIIGSVVKRSYRSKWRVSFKEYSERYYPPYCPGYAIIYSTDVVFRLYQAAQRSRYFWIDDVHVTGVLAQQTNLTISTSSSYVLYSDKCEQLLNGRLRLNDVEFLFAWHSISPEQIRLLWDLQQKKLAAQLEAESAFHSETVADHQKLLPHAADKQNYYYAVYSQEPERKQQPQQQHTSSDYTSLR